jgi:proline iminopeptidase
MPPVGNSLVLSGRCQPRFPDHWQEFIAPIPEPERHDLLSAHHRRLTGSDEIGAWPAPAWSLWEGRTATLLPNKHVVDFGSPRTALSLARIEAHYFAHHSFLEPDRSYATRHA